MSTAMSLAGYYHWFHREWMRAGLVVAAFLLVYLSVLVAPTNPVLYAMLLCAPLYMLHETEEYLFPGGFVEFANRDIYGQDPETGLLDERLVYWINMGYIWLPLPICGLLSAYDLRWGAWMPYFLIFQALVHVGLSIAARRWYNPGLATACLLHVPFAVWAIHLLTGAHVIQDPWFNIHLLVGFVFILGLPVMGIFAMKRYRKRIPRTASA
jgi:hypothetical protein